MVDRCRSPVNLFGAMFSISCLTQTKSSAARPDSVSGVVGEFEKLAYEAALRGLDRQERLVEELRARTGILFAASSLAASVLGQQAFRGPSHPGLVIVALLAFVVSMTSSVFVLLPKKDLIFAEAGGRLYESLYAIRSDMAEVYRRLAYALDRFWELNDEKIGGLTLAYTVAASALVVETLSLVALLSGSIFS